MQKRESQTHKTGTVLCVELLNAAIIIQIKA